MIYVDDAKIRRKVGRYHSARWCHLVALPPFTVDMETDLLAFGAGVGLDADWIQKDGSFLHFDVTVPKRRRCLAAGAIPITFKNLVLEIRAWKRLRGEG